ncbi:hypothetical protein E2C01_089167 [Portunus trituberculatus]|uniref:Uncharacterized protein n=1 Tax=Portunus trituberculatus TaxID=210409 RepID=A0A5B7JLH9_PORTR|nr:hypothetical protein [Portunus trituberculatus]
MIDYLPVSQPSHSLPQPATASHASSQPSADPHALPQPLVTHQAPSQHLETAHSEMVTRNIQGDEQAHTNTAQNSTAMSHSVTQLPEEQCSIINSIADTPDALTAPQHTAEDEILSLAFAACPKNSVERENSLQHDTAATEGPVTGEQQVTASPNTVNAVREVRRPKTARKGEKCRVTLNSRGFPTRYLTTTTTTAATTATTTATTASVTPSDIYQSISRLRRDFSIIQNQILGTERERKKIRRHKPQDKRDANTQTHVQTKQRPLRTLDLSCESGGSDRSTTIPNCGPKNPHSRRKGHERSGVENANISDNAGFKCSSSSSSSFSSSSSSSSFATQHHATVPRVKTAPSNDLSSQNALVIYINNFK